MRNVGLVAALCVALLGCASITRGTSETVTFVSEPPGAAMHAMVIPPCEHGCSTGRDTDLNEVQEPKIGPSCLTPCALPVPRNEVWSVTFALAGYEPKTVRLEQKVAAGGAAGVAGNVIIGGATGLFVDAVTGAGFDHTPNPVSVQLQQIGKSQTPPHQPRKRKEAGI